MQDRMEESRRREEAKKENEYLDARERELSRYREIIEHQERELDAYRSRLKEEQIEKERELRKEFEEREKFFVDRERKLLDRQKNFEKHFHMREAEVAELRHRLENEVAQREADLKKAAMELQQEKERLTEEGRKKLEQTSRDYVADALEALGSKESKFHTISKIWSGIGAGAMVIGFALFVVITFTTNIDDLKDVSWPFLIFTLFKGIIAVGLLLGVAKYSYLFSSSYMQESLKNADRRHAINFGKFYLESYGSTANWSEVKEAFEHWNITGINAFSKQESPTVDAGALEKALEIIEKAGKSALKVSESAKKA
ncbi:hypothetical protein [Francisella sciaenopsi]|uniref:Uncharacterized protein n=1 Tax=Francisella sciaenopsi TaxID=3055034 RepID=A0ABQ6PHQ0_9GAMM